MLNQYDPNVRATNAFLRLLNVKVNGSTVNETLQNHPDWPSLLCISDALNKWHIPNGAGKTDVNRIDELPVPFIAYTKDREAPLAIVTNITETTIRTRQGNYNKDIIQERTSFLKAWTGIYLIAEPNENSGEPGYTLYRKNNFFSAGIPAAAVAVTIVLSFFLLLKNITSSAITSASAISGIWLQYIISLAGLGISVLLVWYEIDKNNPLLQKVCTGIAKGNCHAILSGKAAKVFSWLSWSEVGFFYFAGAVCSLLFSGAEILPVISLIAALNLAALAYPFFSVYYQWRIAKQWCILCLAVQALLVTGGVNILVNHLFSPLSAVTLPLLLQCFLLYLLPVLAWYAVKPYILRLQEAKNTKREYLRIKFNTEIFDTLLKKQKPVTVSAGGLGITLGSPAAVHELIKVCNPFCGPCAKAHPKIEALLEKNENLKVRIIFNAPDDENNVMAKTVRHLLAIEEKGDNVLTKKALGDWYLSEKKDYELFALAYPMNGELSKQGSRIEAMHQWCKTIGILFTPTIFINGYQLPDAYGMEDLEYFLLE